MEDEKDFLSPRTPPPINIGDLGAAGLPQGMDTSDNSGGKGKRRHRRANKGRKRKQKSSLLISNDDGSQLNIPPKQSKMINLRPTNNPLINAPKNSTQFIIDDHENSNLFWNFEGPLMGDGEGSNEEVLARPVSVEPAGTQSRERYSPDDESFWTRYSERDFENVYETAHQEEIFGWERERIVREIASMEVRQKQLIEMLAAVDPVVYLEKLQQELLSLQEVNRELKLVNISEKLHRQERMEREGRLEDSDSDSRLPDSTSQEGETREDEEELEEAGCASGCCLKNPCDETCDRPDLADVEEESEDEPGTKEEEAGSKEILVEENGVERTRAEVSGSEVDPKVGESVDEPEGEWTVSKEDREQESKVSDPSAEEMAGESVSIGDPKVVSTDAMASPEKAFKEESTVGRESAGMSQGEVSDVHDAEEKKPSSVGQEGVITFEVSENCAEASSVSDTV